MDNLQSDIPLDKRFDALLVSNEYANRLIGKTLPGKVKYEESEQGDARRRLLHVERLAVKQKLNDAQAHAKTIERVRHELHDAVSDEVDKVLSDGVVVATKILNIQDQLTTLLDVLSTRVCSISKLEPLVGHFSWMQDELLKIVNTAEHRRTDSHGRAIEVDSVRTALSFLGIDNLRKIIPSLILKHSLPQITDPFPQIKNRINEYALGVANSAAAIAEQRGQPVFAAYVFGMLSCLGMCVTWRQFFRTYDKVHRKFLEEAMKNREQLTHSALQIVQPSPERVIDLKCLFADPASTRIFEYLMFKRLNLLAPWTDHTLPAAKTLASAQKYSQLKMLIRFKLVEKEEVSETLKNLSVTRKELDVLMRTDIFKIQAQQFCG